MKTEWVIIFIKCNNVAQIYIVLYNYTVVYNKYKLIKKCKIGRKEWKRCWRNVEKDNW